MKATPKKGRIRYRVTIGDINGNANAVLTNRLERAEQYLTEWLGREWGDDRDITVGRIYEWNGSEYVLHSEMEY